MKGKMITIPVTGEIVTKELNRTPGFMELKAAINDGYLELIPHFNRYDGEPCAAFCDEEGKVKGLPYNYHATALWQAQNRRPLHDVLNGPIVVITGDEQLMKDL